MNGDVYCLQCGNILFLKAVPENPENKNTLVSEMVTACACCGSRAFNVPGNKIMELTAQRDELLSALRALYGWQRAEVEHFGATTPDDFIIEMVEKAIKNA